MYSKIRRSVVYFICDLGIALGPLYHSLPVSRRRGFFILD
nr:MAG TPA: hypothetical protein [Caudoviricetes sp.]